VAPSASVCSLNTILSGFRASSLASFRLALGQRQRAEILAVELQQVECVQHRVRCLMAAVERIEHRDAVTPGARCLLSAKAVADADMPWCR
jgi:hypothetical protein